jgi:AAA domain, putative AbiEii toxin, Type IV TA system
MIRVEFSPSIYPAKLRKRFEEAAQEVAKAQGDEIRRIMMKLGRPLWPEAKKYLVDLFKRKCAYCESRFSDVSAGVILHYRPKSVYPWLAFELDNILVACTRCGTMKQDRFPIRGTPAPAGARGGALEAEGALLLHPFRDELERHLSFLPDGTVLGTSENGRATIDTVGLNRMGLVEERRRTAVEFDMLVDSFEENYFKGPEGIKEGLTGRIKESDLFDQLIDSYGPFLALRRAIIRDRLGRVIQELATVPGTEVSPAIVKDIVTPPPVPFESLAVARRKTEESRQKQRSYSVESVDADQDTAYKSSLKRIERIRIKDLKAIESLDLTFPEPDGDRESWLMLLGENGVGKSTVLQGVALALMGEEHANDLPGLSASRFVREESKDGSGFVRVDLTNVGSVEVRFRKGSDRFEVEPRGPKVLVLGYGATRLLPDEAGRESSARKAIRIENLFTATAPLCGTESWLTDPAMFDDGRFDEFGRSLVAMLMLPDGSRVHRDKGKVEVEVHGRRRSLRDLSEGYKSITSLLVDIAYGVSDKWPSLQKAEGVVLLDEIEAHLHPRWKISIVDRLCAACPRLAFLSTTHDPLCLKGLSPREIVRLSKDDDDRVTAETDIPEIEHLRSDQLLTSFLFGLESTRDRMTGPMIARYSQLLGMARRTPREQQEFDGLKEALTRMLSDSVTPSQRRVEVAVKHVLAAMRPGGAEDDSLALDAEVRRRVLEILGGEAP